MKNSFLIVIFAFLYVFMPIAIIPFNVIHILAGISYIFLFTVYSNQCLSILRSKELKYFLILQTILVIYTILMFLICSGDSSYTYYSLSLILEILPCAILIAIVLSSRIIQFDEIYNILLLLGFIQAIFAIMTYVLPEFRTLIMNAYSQKAELFEVFDFVQTHRMFGVARGYTFSMPIYQGACIIIAYILGVTRSAKYFILIPFYLISIVLNARFALIALFIAPLVIVFFGRNIKLKGRLFSLLFISIIVISFIQIGN
jgi:hypothetical protein